MFRTNNLWSVKIQAPVRFEWAVKSRVLLPVSNSSECFCHFLQPSIHLILTTPCPEPGPAPVTSRETEAVKRLYRLGPTGSLNPCSLSSRGRIVPVSVPAISRKPPSAFQTLLCPQPGASQVLAVSFSSHYSLCLSFHSQAS
uniref:Uncharacterized protein DKFZp459E0411 n=1 Tax=Pongo abelii TaxID=9601 RepID=Q5R4B5_PONAB|nr:hypothetical protein [Pongo abelii]